MNEQVIISLANAIEANAIALQKLIDAIPQEVKAAVGQKIKTTLAKQATQVAEVVPQPIVQSAEPTPLPIVEAPVTPLVATVSVPAAVSSVPTPAPVAEVPFNNAKGLLDYLMAAYRQMPERIKELENVLHVNGYRSVNEVKPESYAAIYAGIEALK